MKCPYCGKTQSEVIETRDTELATRRRRECLDCKKRFTTYERVDHVELVIIKKDGRREKFDREKLKKGIVRAAEKRPVSSETVEQILDQVERELLSGEGTEVKSKKIGDMVLMKLKGVDKVAYVRFASVYMDFGELSDFEKLIEKLQ